MDNTNHRNVRRHQKQQQQRQPHGEQQQEQDQRQQFMLYRRTHNERVPRPLLEEYDGELLVRNERWGTEIKRNAEKHKAAVKVEKSKEIISKQIVESNCQGPYLRRGIYTVEAICADFSKNTDKHKVAAKAGRGSYKVEPLALEVNRNADKHRAAVKVERPKEKASKQVLDARQAAKRRLYELDQNVERDFEVRKILGKGAYGIVWRAIDKRKKHTVAIKKIFGAFRDNVDAQRTYREVVFLRALSEHPNIMTMYGMCKASNNLDFYLVFEYVGRDLDNIIRAGDVLKDLHCRYIMYQLMNAIHFMHSGNVVHRDLKPSNILIDKNCSVKVADFGLARSLSPDPLNNNAYSDCDSTNNKEPNQHKLSGYVATRWYRAPELLVGNYRYSKAVDMWSVGCILGELLLKEPLFQGVSTRNQVAKIVAALPEITEQEIQSMEPTFGKYWLTKTMVRDNQDSLYERLEDADNEAMSLLKSMLVFNPQARIAARDGLAHPYVKKFYDPVKIKQLSTDIKPTLNDNERLSIDDYRSALYNIMTHQRIGDSHNGNSNINSTNININNAEFKQSRCRRS